MKEIRNIVFDLGGVLIDLDRDATFKAMNEIGIPVFEQHLNNCVACEGFLGEYERGEISSAEFRDRIRELAPEHNISDHAIDTAWMKMLVNIPQYKLNLLEELNKKYRVFLLSNTNELHINHVMEHYFTQNGKQVSDFFEKVFVSNEMGVAKPDPVIYRKVIDEANILPHETLFIDDAPINIEAARNVGIKGVVYMPGADLTTIFELF